MSQLRKGHTQPARGTLRLLIAEDSPADVELTIAVLKRAGYAVSFDVADTLQVFEERLRNGDYSLILSDHNLQSWTGMDALEKLRESGKDIPFVVVTATLGDEGAVEYIKHGAADFVLKHRMERLPVAVSQALRDKANREAQAQLQEEVLSSKRDWELTFDAVPDAILLLDEQCRVQRANRAASEVLGKPFSEMVGRPCYEVLHASARERPDCPHAVLLATGREAWGEVEEPRLGKVFHATSTPLRDSEGKLYGCVYVMRDITERKLAESEKHRSDERFRLATRATNDAIWDWDLETNRVWWNETVSERFGYKPAEVRPDFQWRRERIHEEDRPHVLSSLHGVISSGMHAWSAEYRFERADGKYAEVLDRAYVIRNAQGKGVRMIGAITDLTERKQLEGQLQQAVKMEAIGRLAGGVAHDFNNMLGIMMGYSELLAAAAATDEKLQGYCEQIKKAGHKAAGLTRQLLAFSRQQVLRPQVVKVNRILEETQSMLKRLMGEDVALELEMAEDLWLTKVDADQMNQILMNLAANARDAMPNGGAFTIRTSNATLDESYRQMHPVVEPGDYVLISVGDTGTGMDDRTRAHIFEPFFTTKEPGKGTGLGLATVYGIVKQSGGFIWVYSEVGQGTLFKIYLPRTVDVASPEEMAGPRLGPSVRGDETVLLVEDEEALRGITRQLLEQGGYRVLEAEDAFRALDILQEYAGTIHLVVTDVVMPGMSGPELIERIKELYPETRVLYISGYADRTFHHHRVEEGVAILEKPYSGSDLLSKVQEVLARA